MNIAPDLIIAIIEVILIVFLPYIFENNLWSNDLPKTIEDFNVRYESKINRILSNNTNNSSKLLSSIVDNTVRLDDEEDTGKYNELLEMHEKLLIEIRIHVDIEEKHRDIEKLYQNFFSVIKDIKNLTILVIIFYFVCLMLFFTGYFDKVHLIIQCGMYCLTFYSIFRIIELYCSFKNNCNALINYKNWILENDKNIPRIIDNMDK